MLTLKEVFDMLTRPLSFNFTGYGKWMIVAKI